MRTLSILYLIFVLISCNSKVKSEKPEFLIGTWIRVTNTSNTKSFENWDNNLNGLGYTIKKQDTVFKEILKIEKINGIFNLKVTGVNELPTYFLFTSQTDTSFTCQNEKNKFPKKIEYWKNEEKLYARISSDTIKIDFAFARLK
ncbi:hypothetical protein SAMN04489761_1739 [Tenacibaculum sp. MAR_2009_124]|uniref:DUF6265 family protein n=1 Tax=Tenacibaculum sp. MAR_2009_124 TaxID=1250059 RepID=UPI000898DBA8|nr:DUF6265 family protein [Tenacibaculum sp. MAR_2009_124]SEB77793.1 hypothetical protein SAMN04489761_1739 [Tenacibaculum sp. MAR_2009_124]